MLNLENASQLVRVRNISGATAPPFAAMELAAAWEEPDGHMADSATIPGGPAGRVTIANGPAEIPTGRDGLAAFLHRPAWLLYEENEDGDEPIVGGTVGPQTAKWAVTVDGATLFVTAIDRQRKRVRVRELGSGGGGESDCDCEPTMPQDSSGNTPAVLYYKVEGLNGVPELDADGEATLQESPLKVWRIRLDLTADPATLYITLNAEDPAEWHCMGSWWEIGPNDFTIVGDASVPFANEEITISPKAGRNG